MSGHRARTTADAVWIVHFLAIRRRCQRRIAPGVTKRCRRSIVGRARTSAAKTARSAQSRRGFGWFCGPRRLRGATPGARCPSTPTSGRATSAGSAAAEKQIEQTQRNGSRSCPAGPHTPTAQVSSAGRLLEPHTVKIVSAVDQRGELSFQVHEGSMDAQRFIEFLKSIFHDFDTPIFLVVDGSSAHRAKIVKEFRRGHGRAVGVIFPAALLTRAETGRVGQQERQK